MPTKSQDRRKVRLSRALGIPLTPKAAKYLEKRPYGPGEHGRTKRKTDSDYAVRLREKQRLREQYGIREKQMRIVFNEARGGKGLTGENLVELLERRLDAVIYRMKFAITPFASRQLVSHGHVKVNGRRVNIASYLVRDNDVIELTSKAKEMARVIESTQSAERDVPEYVNVDHKEMKGTFVRGPKLADVPYPVQMEPSLVVEYYSR